MTRRLPTGLFLVAALLVAAVVAGLTLLGGPDRPARPDIVLVTIDTLRADHCSSYGYTRLTTPRLDALAAGGVRFEEAYAPMATTAPSHASMFTGRLPRSHGVTRNGQSLSPVFPAVAESLRADGYRTGAFVSSYVLARRFGLGKGFTSYDDIFQDDGHATRKGTTWEGMVIDTPFDRPANETIDRVERALDKLAAPGAQTTRPFLLWVHLFDPHSPYTPPTHARFPLPGTPLENQIARYDGEIRFADEQLGRLVDTLAARGRLANTLLVVVGDHGEGLMDHGHMEHGLQLYEEAVRVPLVLHWPARIRGNRVIVGPATVTDLAPTMLDLAGLPFRDFALDGRSLGPSILTDAPLDEERPIFFQRRTYQSDNDQGVMVQGQKFGVRIGPLKYIEAEQEATFELYDLRTDPRERSNLFATTPEVAGVLAGALRGWRQRPAAPSSGVPDDVAERLRALGYVR